MNFGKFILINKWFYFFCRKISILTTRQAYWRKRKKIIFQILKKDCRNHVNFFQMHFHPLHPLISKSIRMIKLLQHQHHRHRHHLCLLPLRRGTWVQFLLYRLGMYRTESLIDFIYLISSNFILFHLVSFHLLFI